MEKPKSSLEYSDKARTSLLFGILGLILIGIPIFIRYKTSIGRAISVDFIIGSVLLAILSVTIGRIIGKPELKRLRIREKKLILLGVKPEEEAIALDNINRRKIMALIAVSISNLFILAIILYILFIIWIFVTGSYAS